MTHSEKVKNLILTLCHDEHIPVETLHRLIGIKSLSTFNKRLEDPSKFKAVEIDRIAYVLELTKEERDLLCGKS